jgi:hypothetical protein
MDDLPPWDDINPPALRASQRLSESLEPASREDFGRELTKCLSLVAPVGMTEDARVEWLTAAWEATGHLPADLLHLGAAHARRVADHPSKIVPAIIAETEELLRSRRRSLHEDRARAERALPAPEQRLCTPVEAEDILRKFGLLEAVRRA